jgi:hypothetical protein
VPSAFGSIERRAKEILMRHLLLWLVLFLVGLLVGFIPQYTKARHFEWQANFCDASLQLAQVRRPAALMYVSATQLNYGMATSYANQFFEQARQLAGTSPDSGVRSTLSGVLSSQDKIMTELAKGNAQVVSDLQPILLEIEGASK